MPNGYGRFNNAGIQALAHRAVWFLIHGSWPSKHVLHECDGGASGCVRPEHLREGTQKENSRDMMRRGRHFKGEQTPWAKLTESDVIAIKREYAAGGVTQQELAERYRVGRRAVGRAIDGTRWAHLAGAQ